MRVSLVLPNFNECHNIDLVFQALRGSLESKHSLQFIMVDDQSSDGTADQPP
jgi:glycosyltransferase involved in cell wall biosynthesis